MVLGLPEARSTVLELRIDTLDFAHAEHVLAKLLETGVQASLLPW